MDQSPPWPIGPSGKPPRLIGHRGAAAHAPENTVAGLRAAAGFGLAWVEIDARLTSDDVPVVIHDDTLDRTTGLTGPVRAQPARALAGADAGGWFDRKFGGESLPTLATLLSEAAALGLSVNVELKADAESALPTGTVIGQALASDTGPDMLISSFDRASLWAAAAEAPDLPRALNAEQISPATVDWAVAQGCAALHVAHAHADREGIRAAKSRGLLIGAFTVNDARTAQNLFASGVDYVFTDDPPALAEVAASFP